jgi:galactokinase
MSMQKRVTEGFAERFGDAPAFVVRAPGRVNLIGEHTDYNDGFVLPMAIDRAVWMAVRPRHDHRVLAHSIDLEQASLFSLGHLERGGRGWVEYGKGVAWALQEAGYRLGGWEGVITGDVPIGAGLSSSAAMEMAAARAFCAVSGLTWNPSAMALLGQRAEDGWVGVHCGVMDQMISAGGVAGHALLIDCRTLESEPVPLPSGTAVLVLDTSTRRGLVDSAYNERRAECEAAARELGVTALRDISLERLEAIAGARLGWKATHASHLQGGETSPSDWLAGEIIYRRARHVVSENTRTLAAAEAMRRHDAAALGRLMAASHDSLRVDFEVSSPELNAMVACASREPACYGARMTGAGFGGCAVALIGAADDEGAGNEPDTALAPALPLEVRGGRPAERIAACYQQATGIAPAVYVCQATSGAEVVETHLPETSGLSRR